MERVAVFVDAGYLFAQGGQLLSGRKLTRSELELDHNNVVSALESFAVQASGGLPLLRIYWYDGTSTGPTAQHVALAYLAKVKVRLGFVNSVGEQKGVDSLIVTDMITLARNRAMANAVLLSGDEDLRVGVQQAQEFGVRVHLLGIKPSRGSQSIFLLQESDTTTEWREADVKGFLAVRQSGEVASLVPSTLLLLSRSWIEEVLQKVAWQAAGEIPVSELRGLIDAIKATGQVPKDIDVKLLTRSRTES